MLRQSISYFSEKIYPKDNIKMVLYTVNRGEITGEWSKLHNNELNYLYSSPNIVQVIKSRTMSWVGHAAHMGERRGAYTVLVT
jgi:hypothetical protein